MKLLSVVLALLIGFVAAQMHEKRSKQIPRKHRLTAAAIRHLIESRDEIGDEWQRLKGAGTPFTPEEFAGYALDQQNLKAQQAGTTGYSQIDHTDNPTSSHSYTERDAIDYIKSRRNYGDDIHLSSIHNSPLWRKQ